MTTQEKIDLREKDIKEMRALNDACKNEAGEIRSMTSEEKNRFDAFAEEVRKLGDEIAAEKRQSLVDGFASKPPVEEEKSQKSDEMREFNAFLRGEQRTRTSDALTVDGTGDDLTGAALAPQQYVAKIIADVEKETPLLQKVNMIHLNKAASIGVPYESSDASDAAWTTEVPVSLAADTAWAFGKRELGAHQLIKLVKVTRKLLKTSAFDVSDLVGKKLSYKLRCAIESAILTGNGSGKPLGVFTASANGISTARDVTAATTTTISADNIIQAKRKVDSAYRRNAVWVFNPTVLTSLYTLKDKNDQYIWRSGLTADEPDMLDGHPVIESSFAPGTMTAGLYTGVFGDFSNYWMTMVDQISIQVLLEAFATSGEVGYLATVFADGAPVNEKAFSRIIQAAS